MRDIKPSLNLGHESPFKLDKQGSTSRRYPKALTSAPYTLSGWNDEAVLGDVYILETETLLKNVTGAKRVMADQLVMRNNTHTEVDGLAAKEDGDESW